MTAGDLAPGVVVQSIASEVSVEVAVGRTPHLDVIVQAPGLEAVEVAAHGTLSIVAGESYDGRLIARVPLLLLGAQYELTVLGPNKEPLAVVHGVDPSFRAPVTQLAPMLVHQLARGGTTVLMRLLAAHPEIAAFDRNQLETRLGLSLLHALAVTGGGYPPGERRDFVDGAPDLLPTPHLTSDELGAEAAAWAFGDGLGALRDGYAAAIDGTYRALRPSARFWAEKFQFESPGAAVTQQLAIATWPATRQVIVLRDPRDLVCSRLSFNSKRSFGSFGLELGDDHESAVPVTARHVRMVLDQLDAFPDAAVVRYEDLVGDPVAAATRLFGGLGLAYDWATVRHAVDASTGRRDEQHMTTSSAAASVGRWRTELPPAALSALERELGSELERLGYTD